MLKNPRHEVFAQLVAKGVLYAAAYAEAFGPKKNRATEDVCANQLLRNTRNGVEARIQQIRREAKPRGEWTLEERLEFLRGIAEDSGRFPRTQSTAVKATETYSKLKGDAAPDKLALSGSVDINVTVEHRMLVQTIQWLRSGREQDDPRKSDEFAELMN